MFFEWQLFFQLANELTTFGSFRTVQIRKKQPKYCSKTYTSNGLAQNVCPQLLFLVLFSYFPNESFILAPLCLNMSAAQDKHRLGCSQDLCTLPRIALLLENLIESYSLTTKVRWRLAKYWMQTILYSTRLLDDCRVSLWQSFCTILFGKCVASHGLLKTMCERSQHATKSWISLHEPPKSFLQNKLCFATLKNKRANLALFPFSSHILIKKWYPTNKLWYKPNVIHPGFLRRVTMKSSKVFQGKWVRRWKSG